MSISEKSSPLYQPDAGDDVRALLHDATSSEAGHHPVGAVTTLRVGSGIRVVLVVSLLVTLIVGAVLVVVVPTPSGQNLTPTNAWWSAWLVLALLPALSAQAAGTFTAIAAAENRAAPDDRPVPVLPWRRHAWAWSLAAATLALAVCVVLVPPVPDAGWIVVSISLGAGAGVLVATEAGIALGRQRHRPLVWWSVVAAGVWCTLYATGVRLGAPAAWGLAVPAALLVLGLGLRRSVTDTRPGVPVWTNRRGELMVLSHRLPLPGLMLAVPCLAWIGRQPSTEQILAISTFVLGSALLGAAAQWTFPAFGGPMGSPRVIAARQHALGFGAAGAGILSVVIWNLVGFTDTSPSVGMAGVAAALMGWSAVGWTFLAARRSRRVHVHWLSVVVGLALVDRASSTPDLAWALLATGVMSIATSLLLAATFREKELVASATREALPQLSSNAFDIDLPLWSSAPTIDLTVVVPFLHPGRAVLRENLARLVSALDASGVGFEVLAVDDGSRDDSGDAVVDLGDERLRLISHSRNHGKGGALATGFMHARGRWIGFVDADGDIDAAHLRTYLAAAIASDADVVVADKLDERSSNASSAARKLTSTAMHMVNRRLLRLSVADTQTGAKVYRRELVQEAIPRLWENGFAFDVEMFVVADSLGFRRLLRMPVTIARDGGSTVSTRSTIRTAVRVLAIWRRQALGDYHFGTRTWIPGDSADPGLARAAGILPPQRDVPAAERRSAAEPSAWKVAQP